MSCQFFLNVQKKVDTNFKIPHNAPNIIMIQGKVRISEIVEIWPSEFNSDEFVAEIILSNGNSYQVSKNQEDKEITFEEVSKIVAHTLKNISITI